MTKIIAIKGWPWKNGEQFQGSSLRTEKVNFSVTYVFFRNIAYVELAKTCKKYAKRYVNVSNIGNNMYQKLLLTLLVYM